MKKFAKVLAAALAVILAAALMALIPSAITPEELKVESGNVLYISDNYQDGFGTGQDAENPFEPDKSYGEFDPDAKSPKYHLTTAFYQAIDQLKDTGGTIVVCGPVKLGKTESYGNESSATKDVFTPAFGEHTIKFTSVDPKTSVDYRETKGAKIILETPAEIGVNGQSIWENIDIETNGTDRVISFCGYTTLVGDGVNCYPQDEIDKEMKNPDSYVTLTAGSRFTAKKNHVNSLTVKSGTYNKIGGSIKGVINPNPEKEGDMKNYYEENNTVNLVLDGTTEVLGSVVGTVITKSLFSGNVNITINGGTYTCDIFLVGPTGMYTTDGKVTLTINGGDFSDVYSISVCPLNYRNNPPALAKIDCSNFKGDAASFYGIYNIGVDECGFTEVVWPQTLPEEPKQDDTKAPDVTEAPAPDGTQAPKPAETKKNTNNKGNVKVDGPNKDGLSPVIIVVIIIAVVAVIGGATAVVIVMKKKKASSPAKDDGKKENDKKDKE